MGASEKMYIWTDVPANFPPLPNLHLDMLEDKKKLLKDLPPIPLSTYTGGAMQPPIVTHSPINRSDDESIPMTPVRSYPPTPKIYATPPRTPDMRRYGSPGGSESDGDDLLDALGVNPTQREPQPREQPRHHNEPHVQHEEPKDQPRDDENPIGEDGKTPEEMEELIEEERREYLLKLKMLRKRCSDLTLPPYSEHSTHGELKRIYDDALRELSVAHNFENYKGYLMGGFLLTEFVCTQLFKIDMGGYAKVQMAQITKYDQLLFELGEKSYMGFGSSLPVEIRLIGLILFNAAVFYIGKLVAEKGGESVATLFKGLFGAHVSSEPAKPNTRVAPAATKKRRGPSISVDEIRDLDD